MGRDITKDDLLVMKGCVTSGPRHYEILGQKQGENMAKMLSGDKGGIDKILALIYDNLEVRYLKLEFEDRLNDIREVKIEMDIIGVKE